MATPSETEVLCYLIKESNELNCSGIIYSEKEAALSWQDTLFWIYLGVYVGLVLFAGLMSGLTLGLLSLDTMQLKILQESGKPNEQKYANRIYPLVKRHHLLLVTLLLANAVAVESMPIFLDRISDPITAIAISVTAVLLFGEVFPQALCSRYGLAIGAFLSPLVYLLMALFVIVSWPLSKLLDCLLGKEHPTFFRRSELGVLVDLHGASHEENEEPLSSDEILIIKGALQMKDKTVQDAMVPLASVFMISTDEMLNRGSMRKILNKGHSRIPVYEKSKQNILGIVLVKRLLLYDLDTPISLRDVVNSNIHRAFRKAPFVKSITPLYDLLNEFQLGKCHLAVVERTPYTSDDPGSGLESDKPREVVGIITLEDVIEELIQEEIVDEDDVFIDVHRRIRVARSFVRQLSHKSLWLSQSHSVPNRSYPGSAYTTDDESAPLVIKEFSPIPEYGSSTGEDADGSNQT